MLGLVLPIKDVQREKVRLRTERKASQADKAKPKHDSKQL
jgi:hypothetical protein